MKNKQGISLVVLMITIVVVIILLSTIVININGAIGNARISAFANDLSSIEDATTTYYLQNNGFPTKTENENGLSQQDIINLVDVKERATFEEELKLNGDYNQDNPNLGAFYKIDLVKLQAQSSQRGTQKDGVQNDIYVISYPSMRVYYLKGVRANNNIYFSLTEKIVNKVNIKVPEKQDTSLTTIQTVAGVTVKKMTKNWTNKMGISIQANLETGDELYIKLADIQEKKLTTSVGENNFRFDDIADLTDFTTDESNAFKALSQDKKNIAVIKKKNSQEVGRINVDLSNYETSIPAMTINETNIMYLDEYNIIPFNVSDDLSGIKEIRYEYLKRIDENGNIVNCYTNVNDFDNSYLIARGKRATVASDGTVSIKVDKDIEGVQGVVIDKAGNVNKFTIGMYNAKVYVGLNVKSLDDANVSFDAILRSTNGISNVKFSVSADGTNFTNETELSINSTDLITIKNYSYNNITGIKYVKIVAIDNNSVVSNRVSHTRVFKLKKENVNSATVIMESNGNIKITTYTKKYSVIIPSGFKVAAIDNSTKEVIPDASKELSAIEDKDIEQGLVIVDKIGNEFVWIPVDGVNLKYVAGSAVVPDAEYPSGVTSATEASLVEKAKGFYIGRYEAGVPEGQSSIDGKSASTSNKSGMPVSKKGAIVWSYISYTNANNNAREYMNNENVASGLLSGRAWDTVCKWLENSGYNVTSDSRTWGNYSNSQEPANVDGYGLKQVAGYSDKWCANNIFDLAGSIMEFTNEAISGGSRIYRGGWYGFNQTFIFSASYKNNIAATSPVGSIGYRVMLYVK